jgi:16S rRNA G1207 methylase RsmC
MEQKTLVEIRDMDAKAIDSAKWPSQENRVRRAFETVQDSVRDQRFDTEARILDLNKKLCSASEGDAVRIIQEVDQLRLDLLDAEAMALRVARHRIGLFPASAGVTEK